MFGQDLKTDALRFAASTALRLAHLSDYEIRVAPLPHESTPFRDKKIRQIKNLLTNIPVLKLNYPPLQPY